jgi:SNF2 family DNA or RNA helicase
MTTTVIDPTTWSRQRREERTSDHHLYFGDENGERWVFFKPPHYIPEVKKQWMAGWWDKQRGAWRLPPLRLLVERALTFEGVTAEPEVLEWLDDSAPLPDSYFEQPLREDVATFGAGFEGWTKLYPFQRNAVYSAIKSARGQMEVLNPGLGKTVVAIAVAELTDARVLVIAPKTLRRNWAREVGVWGTGKAVIRGSASDKKSEDMVQGSEKYTITSYEAFARAHKVTLDASQSKNPISIEGPFVGQYNLLVLDETIMLKNRKAQRSKAAKAMGVLGNCDMVLELTGSPTSKGNEDAWMQLNILRPTWLTAYWRFAGEYSIVEQGGYSMQIVGSKSDRKMRDELPELMFARTMEEVLPQLPDYITKVEDIELTPKQEKMHKQILEGLIEDFDAMGDETIDVPNAITAITRASQVTSNLRNLNTMGYDFADESAKADFIMDALSGEGEPVELPMVIWVHHKPGAKALYERLLAAGYKAGLATGDTNAADIIEDYKDGTIDVLVLSLGVGKYGHTLINTKTFVYLDRTMDADAMFQSWWRGRRIGLKHRPVMMILRAPGTIDEFIEDNLAGKMPSMSGVTGQQLAMMLRNIGVSR